MSNAVPDAETSEMLIDTPTPPEQAQESTIDDQLMASLATDTPLADTSGAPAEGIKPKKKRAPAKAKVTVPTSDPNIEVELRTHTPGPKKRKVNTVTIPNYLFCQHCSHVVGIYCGDMLEIKDF